MHQFTLVLPDVFNVKMRHKLNCSRIYVCASYPSDAFSAIALYFNGMYYVLQKTLSEVEADFSYDLSETSILG